MEFFENKTMKKFIITGWILLVVGGLGVVFVEPPLLTPRHPTAYFWFWHNVRHLIASILTVGGVLGVVLLIVGIFTKF